jgi:hypothetical protein
MSGSTCDRQVEMVEVKIGSDDVTVRNMMMKIKYAQCVNFKAVACENL